MKRTLIDLLSCPDCSGDLDLLGIREEDITEGELKCLACKAVYPITNGIPRFVPQDNYASSFGFQWNKFRREQLDSYNGTSLSADRFWSETGWNKDELAGKWVLDLGCGAGRFLDVVSATDAFVVGVDISSAIDAAKSSLQDKENLEFVQASIYDLPFKDGAFDHCYCIGVVQHTPDTSATLRSIAKCVKPGGKLALTIYPRKPWTKLYSKYWLRPVTKRLKKENLLRLIEGIMPVAFPLTSFLFRVPVAGKAFQFLIPIANYVHEPQLTRQQRYKWAILDTFDMLTPYYDQPMTEAEAMESLTEAGVEAKRTQQPGLNLVGVRRTDG